MEKYRLAGELRGVVNRIGRRLQQDPVLAAQRDVTGAHGYIIGYIFRKSQKGIPVFQKDIERDFSIRRSSVTGILNTMEQNGLIVRESVANDKRLKRLVLTDKAIESHKVVASRLDALDEYLESLLTEQESAVMRTVLQKLKDNL